MAKSHFIAQIYSDGFKGLPDGWKSLKTVNFIVGENSTGKTSLFDLLEVLASSEFSFFNQIIGHVDGLSDADDVIRRSRRKKEVTVGFLRPSASGDADLDSYVGLLVTYSREAGELRIKYVTTIFGRHAYKMKMSGKRLMGKLFSASEETYNMSNLCDLAMAAHNDDSTGYSVVNEVDDAQKLSDQHWISAKMYAFNQIQEKMKSKKNQRETIFNYMISSGFEIFRYGPVRSETLRIITAKKKSEFEPSGNHFPHRLKEIFDTDSASIDALQKFGIESGLFDNVRVQRLKGGNTEAFSILYQKGYTEFHASELGYGLGQIIPIVTDLLVSHEGQTYLIQQPEVHLHPRAQAAFGEFLAEIGTRGATILVETHSDFLIDRYRIAKSKHQANIESQILFFEHDLNERAQKFSIVPIEADGSLTDAPDSYRTFFVNEAIDVFETL